MDAVEQTTEGKVYHLRGYAEIRGTDMVFRADEIDYDEDKAYLEARGHVFYQSYTQTRRSPATRSNTGSTSSGVTSPIPAATPRTASRSKPGILTSNTPFYFQGKFAERLMTGTSCTTASSPAASCPGPGGL